jgi:probable F420-dependent oxidoreductase
VRYSVTMAITDSSGPVTELARAVEERGLDGLWFPEHSHVPVSGTSRPPVVGEPRDDHRRLIDPIVGLALATAVTTRIRLGTGVMLVGQRDPITTAKALATLDQQSGGRLVVGIGFGWNEQEIVNHGVDPRTRRARAREHMLTMRRLWEDEVASFDGSHVSLSPSWSWPKPRQAALPVLLGGSAGRVLFDHLVEYGQGWIPVGERQLRVGLPALRDRMEQSGRDPGSLEVVPFCDLQLDQAKVDRLEALGATETAFDVPAESRDAAMDALDRVAEFVAKRR